MKVKDFFFDSPYVREKVSRQSRQFLNRVGGNIRTIARRSMRRTSKASAPGQPPSAHTGKLRDFLFYAFDPIANSVVVGPLRFNQKTLVFVGGGQGRQIIQGAVPHILEFGGVFAKREIKAVDGTWKYVPLSYRVRDKKIPVWLATPEEKKASTSIYTLHKGNRAINFYVIPAAKAEQRIRWITIKKRPYMGPALTKSTTQYSQLWGSAAAFSAFQQQGKAA